MLMTYPLTFGTTLISQQESFQSTKAGMPVYHIEFAEDGSSAVYYKPYSVDRNRMALKGGTGTAHGWSDHINIKKADPSGLVEKERREEVIIEYLQALKRAIGEFWFLQRHSGGSKELKLNADEIGRLIDAKIEEIYNTHEGYQYDTKLSVMLRVPPLKN